MVVDIQTQIAKLSFEIPELGKDAAFHCFDRVYKQSHRSKGHFQLCRHLCHDGPNRVVLSFKDSSNVRLGCAYGLNEGVTVSQRGGVVGVGEGVGAVPCCWRRIFRRRG